MPDFDFEKFADDLRATYQTHDAHVRAAIDLLIWHEYWLRRGDFREACIRQMAQGLVARISWDKARDFADSRPRASSSELAILDLAVALGENRYRLSIMGAAHSRMIVQAVAGALGEEAGDA
jgi:hypothetical protein